MGLKFDWKLRKPQDKSHSLVVKHCTENASRRIRFTLRLFEMFVINSILLAVIGLPFVGAFILSFGKWSRNMIRLFTLTMKAIIFILSLTMCGLFETSLNADWLQFLVQFNFLSNWKICFGVDGISLTLIVLTSFMMFVSLLVAWRSILAKWQLFAVNILLLEGFILLSFTVLDLFISYLAFESVLIPMFLIIGIWGARVEKLKAAWYFFFFTLVGSVFLLIVIIIIYFEVGTTSLLYLNLPKNIQKIAWFSFFIAFAVKIPTWPVHLWLPEAHVEAPTAASIILAALLLKLGGYGYLRFILPLYSDVSENWWWPLFVTFSVGSIVFASLNAVRQLDMKRAVAYSSIAHMNLAVLGMFSFTYQGLHGSMILMLAHGFVSGALFMLIGCIYDRYHSRLIHNYGGLTQVMPLFVVVFLFFTVANMGFPGTYNFVGELLSMVGIGVRSFELAIFAGLGLLASALYSIWLANRLLFGNVKVTYIQIFMDVTGREILLLLFLVFATVGFGLLPKFIDVFLTSSIYWLQIN